MQLTVRGGGGGFWRREAAMGLRRHSPPIGLELGPGGAFRRGAGVREALVCSKDMRKLHFWNAFSSNCINDMPPGMLRGRIQKRRVYGSALTLDLSTSRLGNFEITFHSLFDENEASLYV